MFGNGDMVLHADAKSDAKSMASYVENFYALEEAVHRETTRMKTARESEWKLVVVVVVVVSPSCYLAKHVKAGRQARLPGGCGNCDGTR